MLNRRNLISVTLLIVAAFLLQACASMGPVWQSVPAYPGQGQSALQMSRDQSECEAWARQQTGYDPATDIAKGSAIGGIIGAIGGAAAGAAIGAVTGNPGTGAAIGAAAGGIGGIGVGGGMNFSKSRQGYERAYAVCMQSKGYTVSGFGPVAPAVAPAYAPVVVPIVAPSSPVCAGRFEQEYGWQPDPVGGPPRYVPTGRYLCNGQLFIPR